MAPSFMCAGGTGDVALDRCRRVFAIGLVDCDDEDAMAGDFCDFFMGSSGINGASAGWALGFSLDASDESLSSERIARAADRISRSLLRSANELSFGSPS